MPGKVVVVTGDGRESEAAVGPLWFYESGSAAAAAARHSGAPAAAPLEDQQ